jgi:HEXXH motif-containing protein
VTYRIDEGLTHVERLVPFGLSPQLRAAWRRRRDASIIEFAALAQVVSGLDVAAPTLDRFLRSNATLRGLPPAAVAAVLGSPQGFAWLRRCFECVDVLRGGPVPTRVSRSLLPGQTPATFAHEVFDRAAVFALAAACFAGCDASLAVPLLRPTSLPCTGWHLTPASGGGLLQGVAGRPLTERCALLALRRVPWPSHALVIDPFDAWLASDAAADGELARDDASVAALAARLGEALALIEAHASSLLEECAVAYRVIAPSTPRTGGGYPSGTTSSSLGFSVFATPPAAAILGEMLVHEASHAHLFVVQDIDPLLSPDHHGSGWEREVLYSPWRDDPRPLNGILHAAFVFVRASRFWCSLHESGSNHDRELARRRLAVLRLQLALARSSLDRHARWTAAGAAFFGEVHREIGALLDETARLGLDSVSPLYSEAASTNLARGGARERQRAHFAQWRVRHPGLDGDVDDDVACWLAAP